MISTRYHLINSVAGPVYGHSVSLAGPAGYQHLTPVLDTEVLLHGVVKSILPECLSPHLSTGSASPIVPVRAILMALEALGLHDFSVNIVNLGLSMVPEVEGSNMDFSMDTISCPQQFSSPPFTPFRHKYVMAILRAAHRMAHQIYHTSTPDTYDIIAECVPGGTTTASLCLSMICGQFIETPSSSHLSETKLLKNRLVSEWLAEAQLRYVIDSPLSAWKYLLTYGDYQQAFMYCFLHEYAKLVREYGIPHQNPVVFAGGTQMAAPLALFVKTNPYLAQSIASCIKLATTPWVMASTDNRIFRDFISPFSATSANFAFKQADGPFYLYELGYTKEGCGLGAMIWFAQMVFGIPSELVRKWCLEALSKC